MNQIKIIPALDRARPETQAVLVTGASAGIGRATALELARHGYVVYASARRLDTLSELIRAGCRPLELDVDDEASRLAAIRTVERETGAVSVLVNNAGYGQNGVIEHVPLELLRRQFETNVFGLYHLCQLVLPGMRAQGFGRIINVGSVGGTFTAPGAGVYHMSKYAVESLSDALRVEVRRFGVDVVLVQPTGVFTPFLDKVLHSYPAVPEGSPYAPLLAAHRRNVEMIGQGKVPGVIRAEDVARTIARAVRSKSPRTRYKVGWSAYLYSFLRRWLPERAFDRMLEGTFS